MPLHIDWLVELHPMLVHLPIAALLLAFTFETAGLLRGSDSLRRAGTYTLGAGAAGAALAVASGLLTPEGQRLVRSGSIPALLTPRGLTSGRLVQLHEHWGLLLLLLAALWLAVRLIAHARGRSWTGAAMVAGCAALVVTLITGYLGGQLVYGRRFGDGGFRSGQSIEQFGGVGGGSVDRNHYGNIRRALWP